MILSTTNYIANCKITQHLGMVRGSTVRSRNFVFDFVAGLRSLVGGEITEYTKLQAQSREQAVQRMVAEAQALGAEAIVEMRMETAMILNGSMEIIAYGTAVKLEPLTTPKPTRGRKRK